ncbi:hypothetical protein CDAR_198841 [Caerostris darwini]|uniref:RING-type domain-containing protein n=1 Tax=Caerostris darwini TaxID=1538125 RepID=A0AAV4T8H9_9ARAC|nr:hypothetical protein CDAR_198841 [Caerostris darwini]
MELSRTSFDTCDICKDIYDCNSQTICTIPCGHVFHQRCLTTWIGYSPNCATCRREVSHRDMIKLYMTLPSTSERLENDLNASKAEVSELKAKLSENNAELEASRNKIQNLEGVTYNLTETLNYFYRERRNMENDFYNLRAALINISKTDALLQRENERFRQSINRLHDVEVMMKGPLVEAGYILGEMNEKVIAEHGESSAVKMATYSSILNHRLQAVQEERNQLQNEVRNTKRRLDIANCHVQQLRKALERNSEQSRQYLNTHNHISKRKRNGY